jgi:predicted RNase H-like HicB family nuclease
MGKSLTEIAKAVLMKESNDSTPDAGAKSSNPNMATLSPKSKVSEPDPKSNEATLVADAPKKPGEGENVGAKAASNQKKDTSVKTSVPAQKAETMSEEEEVEGEAITEEDDVELSEELEAFIDECVEQGLTEEEIAQAIEENFEFVTEEEDLEEDSEDLKEEAEYEYKVDMSEHINALFAGEELSEEFKAKAIAIFEAAVTTTVQSELASLEEAYASTLEEQVEAIKEELSTNVDDYLNYVVENWVSENEVAIEAGLRTELTEEFISGLKNLFAENYIDIPEDKISVVEELGNKVAELEEKLNEEIERNVELTSILSESKKSEVLHNVVEGLTTTQAEKLKTLAENIEFTTLDEYTSKVSTLRESYFPATVKAQGDLDVIEPGTEGKTMISEELQGPMAKYVQVLGKKLPN